MLPQIIGRQPDGNWTKVSACFIPYQYGIFIASTFAREGGDPMADPAEAHRDAIKAEVDRAEREAPLTEDHPVAAVLARAMRAPATRRETAASHKAA